MNGRTPSGPDGVLHRQSPLSVEDTLERMVTALETAGAKVFAVIDHSGEAVAAGLTLRDTKLIIFGNPLGGTPIMNASPTAALDLPLKVLIWASDQGTTWMTYLSPDWLAERHQVPAALVGPFAVVEQLVASLTTSR